MYGPWALVSGASSGIGKEFAEQLARQGINVVIAARRKDRLTSIASKLSKEHGVEVKAVEVDLLAPGFWDILERETDGLEIGLLVNNAGMMRSGESFDISLEDEMKLIDLNIKAPLALTRLFGEKMIERGKGGIINVSSTLDYMGVPYFSTYSASIAFELSRSEGLWYELKSKGVDVLALSPGGTKTEMAANMNEDKLPFAMMSTSDVVNVALKNLGRKSHAIPGNTNLLMVWMSKRMFKRANMTRTLGKMMRKVAVSN